MMRAREISSSPTSYYLLFDISVSRETVFDPSRSEIAGGLNANIARSALIAYGALGETQCKEKRVAGSPVVVTNFAGLLL